MPNTQILVGIEVTATYLPASIIVNFTLVFLIKPGKLIILNKSEVECPVSSNELAYFEMESDRLKTLCIILHRRPVVS